MTCEKIVGNTKKEIYQNVADTLTSSKYEPIPDNQNIDGKYLELDSDISSCQK